MLRNAFENLSTEATLAAVLAKLSADPATQATLAAILAKQPSSPATDTKLDTVLTALQANTTALGALLTELQAKTEPTDTQPVSGPVTDAQMRATPIPVLATPPELSFIERIALKALAKLTFSLTGMRVDCGGSSVAVSSGTVTTVGTVGTANLVSLGRNTVDGQSGQQSTLLFQSGFRRNLVKT